MNKYFFIICFLLLGSAYGQVNLTKGLYVYYPLDGNATDYSSNKINGTVFGAQPCADRFGNKASALVFDGTSNHIAINTIFPDMSHFSISVWVYHTDPAHPSGIFS